MTAAALANGGITAATARMTTAIEAAVAAGTTVPGITAVGTECGNRMVIVRMIGATSA